MIIIPKPLRKRSTEVWRSREKEEKELRGMI